MNHMEPMPEGRHTITLTDSQAIAVSDAITALLYRRGELPPEATETLDEDFLSAGPYDYERHHILDFLEEIEELLRPSRDAALKEFRAWLDRGRLRLGLGEN